MKPQAVRKEPLGQIAVILLPSLKMKARDHRGRSHDEALHDFLVGHFDGYTVTAGSIAGYWKDAKGCEHYGEHREYRVAITDRSRLPLLEAYLADLGDRIREKWIYWQTGDDAWLIPATRLKRVRKSKR